MSLPTITKSRAIERAALVELLRAVEPGETLDYEAMTAAIEQPILANRHILAAARADLRDEEMIVFEPVPRVGLRRLTDGERGTIAPDRRRRKSYRQAVVALKEMRGLETALLTDGERQQFLGRLALCSAIAAVASGRALKKVMAAVPDQPTLPVEQTLTMLAEIK
jgi:hypothetical protein